MAKQQHSPGGWLAQKLPATVFPIGDEHQMQRKIKYMER
jgi:hypothetical protein